MPWRRYGRRLLQNWNLDMVRRVAALNLDVLIQDELNHPSLFWLNRRLRASCGCPLISIAHHLRIDEEHSRLVLPLYRFVEQRFLRSVDGFVFNSHTTRQAVTRVSGARPDGVVAYPAADHLTLPAIPIDIAARAAKPGPLRLLFIGSVIPRKRLHDLVSALSQLPASGCRLTIVGDTAVDPPYVQAVRKQVAHLNLTERVTWTGHLPPQQVAHYLARNHLLVVPSFVEGFGIVYLEAMAFGMPPIATTGGAAHEIIDDGQNGFLIEPGDVNALARLIRRLHEDRSKLVSMGSEARKRFGDWPSWAQSMSIARSFLLRKTGLKSGSIHPSE